jgi:hypothetical protein
MEGLNCARMLGWLMNSSPKSSKLNQFAYHDGNAFLSLVDKPLQLVNMRDELASNEIPHRFLLELMLIQVTTSSRLRDELAKVIFARC